jgi:hypothetical protein
MNKLRLSGIVLISSFFVLVLGSFILTPPRLYQERDIDVRMQIVEDYQSQFTNAQIATVVGAAGIAVGFLILTLHLQGDDTARLANFGAAAMLLGTISLAIFMLQGISDPRAYLERASEEGTALSIYAEGFTWLTITAYLLYGIVFLRGDFPRWLAYTTLGITILVLVVALFIEAAVLEILFILMPLIVGIALLRRSSARVSSVS